MIFLNLLLAHLLGDFVFQPHKLIAWKFKSWKGMVLHAFIHFVANLVVFVVFLRDVRVWFVLAGIAVLHFIVDYFKILKEKKGKHFLAYFFIDQAVHIAIILAATAILMSFGLVWTPMILGTVNAEMFLWIGINMLIILTSVLEIVIFQMHRVKDRTILFLPNYKAMIQRAVIFSLVYVLFLVLAVYHAAALGV